MANLLRCYRHSGLVMYFSCAQRTSPLHVTESGLAAIEKAFYMLEERSAYIKQLSHTRFTAGMAPFVIYLKNTITL